MIQLNPKFTLNKFTLNNLKNKHKIAYIVSSSINTGGSFFLGQATSSQPLSKLIHTNTVLYSERNRVNLENTINESLNSRVNNLQLVKYNDKLYKIESVDSAANASSLSESFPWFTDADGKPIEFNETIRMFEGVKLVSDYLVKKLKIDSNLIYRFAQSAAQDDKLTEILDLFKDSNKEITILELFNGLNKIYGRDQGVETDGISQPVLEKLIDNIRNDLDGSDSGYKINSDSNSPSHNTLNTYIVDTEGPDGSSLKISSQSSNMVPFGPLGNTYLNQIGVTIRDSQLNRKILSNSTKLTEHVAPLVNNLVSLGFIICTKCRGYINHVHNRPFQHNLNSAQMQQELKLRRSQLGAFLLVGAPLTYFLVKSVGLSFKDVLKVEFNVGENEGCASAHPATLPLGVGSWEDTPNSYLQGQTEPTASPSSAIIDTNTPNIINTNNVNSKSWLFLLLSTQCSKINKKFPCTSIFYECRVALGTPL